MVLAYHPQVLRKVVAYLVHRLLKLEEEVLLLERRADVHRMRRIEVQRLLVLQLRHLDVHAGVYVAVEVGREHGAVGRELDARDGLVAVELAARALRAYGAREKADLHSVPRLRVARNVWTVGMRPEVDPEHAHRRVRIQELVAA